MTNHRSSLNRRDFVRLGLVAGPASLVASCGWDGGPVIEPRLRAFSRFNDWVGEKLLQSSSRLAPQYPVAERTAEANFPSYSITYNRTGSFPYPPDSATWRLHVGGLVRKPIQLTRDMIEALPRTTYTVKHHCVEGWTAVATWTGGAGVNNQCSGGTHCGGELSEVRLVRQQVLQRLGPQERYAPADNPGVCIQRPPARA